MANEKEQDKDNKEFAVEQLKNGVPQGNIALLIFNANINEIPIDEVKKEFDAATKMVQEAFRSL